MRKGASEIISTILMVLVSTVAVAVVLMIGMPAIDRAKEAGITNEAMKNIQVLDDTIREVASEGVGSLRTLRLQISDGDYRIFNYSGNNSGAVEFRYSMKYNSFPLLGVKVDGNVKTSTGLSTIGLVGYWRLNKINSTNYTLDDSGKGNDGQIITGGEDVFSKQVTGKFGNGLQFDGVNDYVDAGNANSLNPTFITISAWVKTSNTATFQNIVEKTNSTSSGFALYFRSSSPWIRFRINDTMGTSHDAEVTTQYQDGAWHHIVATFNGTTSKMFVDSIDKATTSWTGSIPSTSVNLRIGYGTYYPNYFNGTMDEVQIWNRALTAEEVQEDFNPKQSDFRITIEYDKIDIMGVAKFGKGNQKVCIEKTGSEGTKAIVSVSVC